MPKSPNGTPDDVPALWLGHYSLRLADLDQRWQAAADAGFAGISVAWLEMLACREAGLTAAVLRAKADGLGLRLTQLEYMSLLSARPAGEIAALADEMAELAAELGCDSVTSVAKTDDGFAHPPEPGQPISSIIVDTFGLLCDACAQVGLAATVEFMPFATGIDTLERAVALLRSVNRGNGRLTIDAIHFFRAGADWSSLERLNKIDVDTIQICDGSADQVFSSYVAESLGGRLCPGDGDFDLRRFIEAVSRFDRTFTVEVLNNGLNALPPAHAAQMMARSARSAVFDRDDK
jgi:sugar phosphate isomerase/epimerase